MRSCHFAPLVFAILLGMAVVQSIFSQTTQPGPTSQLRPVQVPFVGCASDGQMGPLKAPMGQGKQVEIPAGDANRLAYYRAKYGPGVLAPRGWHCFSTYGSNGSNLYVSPDPIDTKKVFAPDWKGFTGDAVQVSVSLGDTSGRFQVAKIIARAFPEHKAFVDDVIAEGIETAADFPSGPYPADKLRYIGDGIVEFETPAQAEGLGTDSQLQRNGKPIRGVAILLGETPDLTLLSIRIPDANLVPVIMKSIEGEAADSESKSKSQN